jgi:thiol-disulfide isomerase/thioredoxin
MSRSIIIALVAIIGVYWLYERINSSDSDQEAQTTSRTFGPTVAPNFTHESLSGEVFNLEEQRGKVVLLNFWATWCTPCWEEMPMLVSLQDELREAGFLIVGISVDEEGPDIVREFVDDFNFNYEILHDDIGLAAKYGAEFAVPTSIIIDKTGYVRHRIIGLIDEAELKPVVVDLLNE